MIWIRTAAPSTAVYSSYLHVCLNIIDLGFKVLYELPKWLIGFISGCSRVGIPSEGREACACVRAHWWGEGRELVKARSQASFWNTLHFILPRLCWQGWIAHYKRISPKNVLEIWTGSIYFSETANLSRNVKLAGRVYRHKQPNVPCHSWIAVVKFASVFISDMVVSS